MLTGVDCDPVALELRKTKIGSPYVVEKLGAIALLWGIEMAGTSVARQSIRNRKMTMTTISTARPSERSTSDSAPEMKIESSLDTLMSTPLGSVGCNCASAL